MRLKFSPHFKKKVKKLPKPVKVKLGNRLTLFVEVPYNAILRNHALSGEWKNYRSINVTGDYRAIFKYTPQEDTAYFVDIGTHGYLYK